MIYYAPFPRHGEVAQLVEHHVRNVGVESSNLFFSTSFQGSAAIAPILLPRVYAFELTRVRLAAYGVFGIISEVRSLRTPRSGRVVGSMLANNATGKTRKAGIK